MTERIHFAHSDFGVKNPFLIHRSDSNASPDEGRCQGSGQPAARSTEFAR